jgi:hypothetical protein
VTPAEQKAKAAWFAKLLARALPHADSVTEAVAAVDRAMSLQPVDPDVVRERAARRQQARAAAAILDRAIARIGPQPAVRPRDMQLSLTRRLTRGTETGAALAVLDQGISDLSDELREYVRRSEHGSLMDFYKVSDVSYNPLREAQDIDVLEPGQGAGAISSPEGVSHVGGKPKARDGAGKKRTAKGGKVRRAKGGRGRRKLPQALRVQYRPPPTPQE